MVIRRHKILIAIALTHLALVTLGASSVDLSRFGRVGRALEYYGSVSGAGDSYGFFAPGITGQLRARFELVDARGRVTTDQLETGVNHEADLRVRNIIDQFQGDVDDPEVFQRSLAATLAGTMFGRHPDAREVVFHLDRYTPVTMGDYRRGLRPTWSTAYEATFRYDPPKKGGSRG